jgi:formylmethanofuran dehydrogenase subunit C
MKNMQDRPTHRRERENRQGAALVIVLGLVLLMGMTTAMMARVTGQSAFRVKKILRSSHALAIAEAGVGDVLDTMNTNFAAGVGVNYREDFGDGNYTVSTAADATSGNIIIVSTGVYQGESRTTRLELLGDKYAIWNALAGQCAIIAGGNATLETAAPIIEGRVHANGSILHKIGNIKVQGDLTANGLVQISPQSGYVAIPGHAEVSVPTYLPFDPWRELAQNGGLYYEGNQAWNKVTLRPGNGVVYVNGDVEINNRSSLVGTLVASGSISINNRFTQTQFATQWPSLLAGVDLNLLNRNRYTGAVFAGNNIVTRNNKVIDGQLIALNNVYVENRAEIPTQSDAPIWNPNGTPDPEIVVGGWLQ